MANFEDKIEKLAVLSKDIKNTGQSETAVKQYVVSYFIGEILGYNERNYNEVQQEFTSTANGLKEGDKVDYALKIDGKPVIFIEAKSAKEALIKHTSQLFRYFGAFPNVKVGILINGKEAWFYTDKLNTPNYMNDEPFFKFNIREYTNKDINRLKFFCKEGFSSKEIKKLAREWQKEDKQVAEIEENANKIKKYILDNVENPSEAFVRFIMKNAKTKPSQGKTENFKPMVKSAFAELLHGNKQIQKEPSKPLQDKSPPPKVETPAYAEGVLHQNPIEEVQEMYLRYKNGIMEEVAESNDITEEPTSGYFNYKKGQNKTTFAQLRRKSKSIRINLNLNEVSDLGQYAEGCKKYNTINHWGGTLCNFYIELDVNSNYSHAIEQIKIAYEKAGN